MPRGTLGLRRSLGTRPSSSPGCVVRCTGGLGCLPCSLGVRCIIGWFANSRSPSRGWAPRRGLSRSIWVSHSWRWDFHGGVRTEDFVLINADGRDLRPSWITSSGPRSAGHLLRGDGDFPQSSLDIVEDALYLLRRILWQVETCPLQDRAGVHLAICAGLVLLPLRA